MSFASLAQALAGGLLIGGAAALLLILGGRIAGVSGIFGALVRGHVGRGAWGLAFIAGLVASPALYGLAGGTLQAPTFATGLPLAVVAGLLTGLGTGLASGCTSGHGVCGLANLSRRSVVATATFMVVAGLTVYVLRHVVSA
jgi:hypothetical protein